MQRRDCCCDASDIGNMMKKVTQLNAPFREQYAKCFANFLKDTTKSLVQSTACVSTDACFTQDHISHLCRKMLIIS